MSHSPTAADNFRGIIALLISQMLFVTSDSFVKLVAVSLPPSQIMALRGVMAVSLASIVLSRIRDAGKWKAVSSPLVLIRAALEAVSAGLFIMSLPHLSLAAITVLMQITPLTITLLSAVVLRDHIGWRRWLAVATGFVGVILVAQPGTESFSYYSISAVMVALLISVRDLITRRLDPSIPTPAVTLTTTASVCTLGFLISPLENWAPVNVSLVGMMLSSAVLVTFANVFIIRAFRGVDVTVVSPFRYFGVLWGILLGYLVWSDAPNVLAVGGMVLIVGSGLYTMHRESLRMRQSA